MIVLEKLPLSIETYIQTELSNIIARGENIKRWKLSNNGCHSYKYLFTTNDKTRTSFYLCLWIDEKDQHPFCLNFNACWNRRQIDRDILPLPYWKQEEYGLIRLISACSTNQYFFYLNTTKLREIIMKPGIEYHWPAPSTS